MMVVYKYPLELKEGIQILELPQDESCFLDIAFQKGNNPEFPLQEDLFIWALINKDCEKFEKRKILMLGTGRETEYSYYKLIPIKTIHKDGFAWHFFELDE